jgi:uncharacterized membrane-anchored protein YhcB (DUF1043 family)
MDPVQDILEVGRRTRKRPSRAMWIAACVVGIGGVIGFLIVVFSGGEAATTTPNAQPTERGLGFSSGLVLGIAIGVALGFVIARQRFADHSSSNKP